MPKNIEDMIVPERKRSIRNIPIPEGRRRRVDFSGPPTSPPVSPLQPPSSPRITYSPESVERDYDFHNDGSIRMPKIPKKSLWIGVASGVLLLVFFIVLSIFDGATLSYTPRSTNITFENESYRAKKSGTGGLLFSVIKLSSDKDKSVAATGEERVSRKASGSIVVFNNATRESQRLRATTRFETADGKVYRIQNDIVVPGKKLIGGKEEPGSIEVVVYADEAGEAHNIGLADFTLPGLKGSSLFSSIYARSKTPMSGGFVGMEKLISAADRAYAEEELQAALKAELVSQGRAQTPEDFVLIDELSAFTFESLPQTNASDADDATINMRGHLNGVMFKSGELATHLAKEKANLSSTDSVDILELDSLTFSFADTAPTNLPASEEIEFKVSGPATVVWRTDETALKADLLGKHREDLPAILDNYPTVFGANAAIRPFWKRSFPEDGVKVMVKKLEAQ